MFLLKGLGSVALVLVAFVSVSLCFEARATIRAGLKEKFDALHRQLKRGKWESAEINSPAWMDFDKAVGDFLKNILWDHEVRLSSDFSLVLNMLIPLEAQLDACLRSNPDRNSSLKPTMGRLDERVAMVDDYLSDEVDIRLRDTDRVLRKQGKLATLSLWFLQKRVCLLFTHSETCIPWKEGYVPKERSLSVVNKQSLRPHILNFLERAGQSIKLMRLEEQDEAWRILLLLGSLYPSGTIERPPTIEFTAPQSRIPAIPSDSEPRKTSIPTMAVVVCLGLGSVAALVGLKLAIRKMSVES